MFDKWIHPVQTIPLEQFMAAPYKVSAKHLHAERAERIGGAAAELSAEESEEENGNEYQNWASNPQSHINDNQFQSFRRHLLPSSQSQNALICR